MTKREQWQGIPTELSLEQFRQFVLPHLSIGSRGPAPKLSLHALFGYILKVLYMGWGVSGRNCRLQRIAMDARRFTTLGSMVRFADGRRMAVSKRSSRGRY